MSQCGSADEKNVTTETHETHQRPWVAPVSKEGKQGHISEKEVQRIMPAVKKKKIRKKPVKKAKAKAVKKTRGTSSGGPRAKK